MLKEPEKYLEVEITHDIPAIYHELNKRFGVKWEDGIIICDGTKIHCKFDLPPQKIIHEVVHAHQQQEVGKEMWWQSYLTNPTFRLEQELQAYKKEYQFICQNVRDRNQRFDFLYEMSRDLSSSIYGKIISFSDAMKLIQ